MEICPVYVLHVILHTFWHFPGYCYLSFHGMADGNVALNGEGGEGESRGVHGEELAENHEGAAQTPPNPEVAQNVV